MSIESIIEQNYRSVLDRIATASKRAGRNANDVTLVAVTKYAQLEWVRALVALGVTELGENRPQQLQERAAEIDAGVHWHLIGHLQRNKVRRTLPVVTLIHSVDSLRLLAEIDQQAAELNLQPRVLIEVNLSGEEQKHGFAQDDLRTHWEEVLAFRRVRLEGLMTMAAYADDPEQARPTFAALKTLRNELRSKSPAETSLTHLSMGMTGDFEVAVEEGATIVRIGSALWEGLAAKR